MKNWRIRLRPLLALAVGMWCAMLNAGISLSSTSQTFGSAGGSGSFTISYTGGLSYSTPSTSVSWLSVTGTQIHTGTGSGTITVPYSVAANNSSSSRTGTISGTVSGSPFTFTVYQNPGAAQPTTYSIKFHKNDGSGVTALRTFTYGMKTRLPLLKSGLGWTRTGYTFKGWATSPANANAKKIWKKDWAYVQTPVVSGKTLNVYAVWDAQDSEPNVFDFYATIDSSANAYYYQIGGTGSASYTSFTSSASWLTPNGTKSASSNGEWTLNVNYKVTANTSAYARTGILTGTVLGSKVRIHITQNGK